MGWVGWLGGGVGLGGVTPMHMCTHTCMPVKHDKHGWLHGGGHLQFPNMFILVFHVCASVWGHPQGPQMTPNPSAPSLEPQGARITKSL